MSQPQLRKLTPPAVAAMWGVSAGKVLAFIRSGELRAIDLARRGASRPRYAVDLNDLEKFEQSREVVSRVKASSSRAHKRNTRDYFGE